MNKYLVELEKVLLDLKVGLGETQYALLYEKTKHARLLLESFKRETKTDDPVCRKSINNCECYLARGHEGPCKPFPNIPNSIKEHEDSARGMQMNVCPKVNERKVRCKLIKDHYGECEF
jgi:hypothetical protein